MPLVTPSSRNSFIDGRFVPIGGQHISAALFQLIDEYKNNGYPEDKIPQAVRFVEAEVLLSTTPLQVARLAAGQHQSHQSNAQTISTADAFAMFQLHAAEKSTHAKSRRAAFFNDAEVFEVIQELGIMYQPKKAFAKEKTPAQQVCYDL